MAPLREGILAEVSEATREAGTAAGALAAKEAGTSVTTREEGTAAGVRTRLAVIQEILVEEGIQARVEEETGDVEPPEHSSSASFCVFCGEEC